jgi:hypothetical protein
MDTIPRTSGIYKIVCVTTGKIYVGSTKNLFNRRRGHFKDLRGNRHVNRHLQSAWNKYGAESFDFVVIELILQPFLLEREQYWLDKLRTYDRRRGFNLQPKAGSPSGYTYTDEVRQKLSTAHKGKLHSKEHSENIGIARSKQWIVTSPDGQEYYTVGLARFCREHDLGYSGMRVVAQGKCGQCRGWKVRPATEPPRQDPRGRFSKEYIVTPPNGQPTRIKNLSKFCRDQGLHRSVMQDLVDGRIPCYRGWRIERAHPST